MFSLRSHKLTPCHVFGPKSTRMNTCAGLVMFIVATVTLSSCNGGGGGGGGITIPQNDSTSPILTLGSGQQGGQNVTVSGGGSGPGQNMKLTSKTGSLNLLATAKDPESGIQAVEIWVNGETTFCDANKICKKTGPGLLGKPTFESTSPKKNPGETTPDSSILAQPLNLSTMIPQGSVQPGESRTVTLIISAVAVNHLGGRTQTPEIKATWSEP